MTIQVILKDGTQTRIEDVYKIEKYGNHILIFSPGNLYDYTIQEVQEIGLYHHEAELSGTRN